MTVTGLAADTIYYYQVETDNGGGGNGTSPSGPDYFFETANPVVPEETPAAR